MTSLIDVKQCVPFFFVFDIILLIKIIIITTYVQRMLSSNIQNTLVYIGGNKSTNSSQETTMRLSHWNWRVIDVINKLIFFPLTFQNNLLFHVVRTKIESEKINRIFRASPYHFRFGGVFGRLEFKLPYWYFAFFSDGFRIYNEYTTKQVKVNTRRCSFTLISISFLR